jgi:hypothetical protein
MHIHVMPCSETISILLSPFLWYLTTQLNSSAGVTKLGPVGPVLVTVM